eukprot:TRINITY_DN6438_c0_g1_i1.p1 TRINITY_DN6438_c0_g1~~TRINITY_DN6438_c0_g1_i1.p1  ORF type:complete len:134 (+),score=1.00 TRINITY_DN6438_c0_g1_i1:77-478(+)
MKRLPIYHPNPAYIVSTRRFSVRSKLFTTSANQSNETINRIKDGANIATTRIQTSVKTAAKKMINARIGCLLVVDEQDEGKFVGVVTERDCMRAISENVSGLNDCIIQDIMTPNTDIVSAKIVYPQRIVSRLC